MDSGKCQTSMDQWPTWLQQVFEDGYFAAMTGQPLNPVAMSEWIMGYALYLDSQVSDPIRRQTPVF